MEEHSTSRATEPEVATALKKETSFSNPTFNIEEHTGSPDEPEQILPRKGALGESLRHKHEAGNKKDEKLVLGTTDPCYPIEREKREIKSNGEGCDGILKRRSTEMYLFCLVVFVLAIILYFQTYIYI